MVTEEQICELARNLKNRHLVTSMDEALERARLILQNAPDQDTLPVERVEPQPVASAEVVAQASSLPAQSIAEIVATKEALAKLKKDLEDMELDLSWMKLMQA